MEQIRVEASTRERTVGREASAQEGVSSFMGLIMATSGCPHTAFFKPTVSFHLPMMATGKETVYRAASMYLLAQYFVHHEGGRPDFAMDGLRKVYENLQTLNSARADRLREAIRRDAAVKALVILDFFALGFSIDIAENLEEVRHLFQPYLNTTHEKWDEAY